jgi:site-specific DNA-methyltransferase (adenine-specific)
LRYPSSRMKRRIAPRTAIGKTGVVHCADALAFLKGLKAGSASVIFLDPPFNLRKRYGRSSARRDASPDRKYFAFMSRVLLECERVLAPGGALYLYHLPRWALLLGRALARRLEFRHWIAVSMKNGFVSGDRLYPAHYALLFFTKGAPARFVRPKLPVQTCRHCGESIKDYGGYKHFVARGINLSDIWDDLSPVRHRPRKHRVANELPPALLARIVKISGHRRGLLVDPFVGSGTSLVAAVDAGMRFAAADREASACAVATRRVGARLREIKGNRHE